MNETERAALVDELAEAMGLIFGPGDVPPGPDKVAACLPIIERLLAERDEVMLGNAYNKGYRAAVAAHDLDALLDSVGAYTVIHHMMFNDDGSHTVEIGKWFENQGRKYYRATGPTRMDAIRAAVAQATTTQEGASDE